MFPDAHVYGGFNLTFGIGGVVLYSFQVLLLIPDFHDSFQWYAPFF